MIIATCPPIGAKYNLIGANQNRSRRNISYWSKATLVLYYVRPYCTEQSPRTAMNPALGLFLLLGHQVLASEINFEDARRLQSAHKACRLRTLESWKVDKEFDMQTLVKKWKETEFKSEFWKSIQRFIVIHGGGVDLKRVGREARSEIMAGIFRWTGILKIFYTPSKLITQVGKGWLDHEKVQKHKQIVADRAHEQLLQKQLNQCAALNDHQNSITIIQSLLYASLESQVLQLTAQLQEKTAVFVFEDLTVSWSKVWHEVREIWSEDLFITESQEWQAVWIEITTGEDSVATSDTWQVFTETTISQVDVWFEMTTVTVTITLEEEGILPGMGYFGHLVILANQQGVDGPIGSAFGLAEPSEPVLTTLDPTPVLNNSTVVQKDFFFRIAESLVPRDAGSRIELLISGKTFFYGQREYKMDPISGKLVLIADYSPAHVIAAVLNPSSQPALVKKVKFGETINMMMNQARYREIYREKLAVYYRRLRAWYTYGRDRGMPEPIPPVFPKHQKTSEFEYKDYPEYLDRVSPWERWIRLGVGEPSGFLGFKSKRKELCSLRKSRRISAKEYKDLSKLLNVLESWKVDAENKQPALGQFFDTLANLRGKKSKDASYSAVSTLPASQQRIKIPPAVVIRMPRLGDFSLDATKW